MPSKGWVIGGAAIAAALLAAWLWPRAQAVAPAAAPAAPAAGRPFFGNVDSTPGMIAPLEREARRQELVQRFQEADRAFCSYREGSKYPVASRLLADNPDQVYPNAPVTEMHDMRTQGGGSDAKVKIQTSQSRVFMAAGEAVAFSIRAVDADGQVLALVPTRALAAGMTFAGARPTQQVVLAFADDGRQADSVAGDGAFAAVLAPSQSGLASFNGTIRTELRYSVAGKQGMVLFDVIYSPELPATWTGQVREAVENGSLNFYLKADIRLPGRYLVSARVDDAKGKPFALASFNDMLPAGTQEVRLQVFGKLLRDQEPALPLTLRDVDGYLLKDNADPDRALMPRLEGKVAVARPYPLKGFSDAEYQGEERTRYLAEFGKDQAEAQAALARIDPSQPPMQSACGR